MQKSASATVPVWFDWAFLFFIAWQVSGAYIDGWAHIHVIETIESFFTPWHAVLYSGFFATAAFLVSRLAMNHRAGYPWKHALPREYLFSLCGVFIFLLGGAGDFLWHTIFGIENGIDALLSPTHLILALGAAIMGSGPLHAIWYREAQPKGVHKYAVVLSMTFMFMVLTFMVQFLNPFKTPWPALSQQTADPFYGLALGAGSIIVFTVLFTGLVLASLKYFKFPPGAFTLFLLLEATGTTLMAGANYYLIGAAVAGGVLIDIAYAFFAPGHGKPTAIRSFAMSAACIFAAVYMITVAATQGTWWSIHFLAGSVVIAGIAAGLLTYLIVPPGDYGR